MLPGLMSHGTWAETVCDQSEIELQTATGSVVYSIEIADDPVEQAQGLMFRTTMRSDVGMLFVFDPPQRASFWMENTMIPLDMIFISDDGIVESFSMNTIPFSRSPHLSHRTVRAVLEVNAGEVAEHGIEPGTKVRHPAFLGATGSHRCPALEE